MPRLIHLFPRVPTTKADARIATVLIANFRKVLGDPLAKQLGKLGAPINHVQLWFYPDGIRVPADLLMRDRAHVITHFPRHPIYNEAMK